MSNQIVIIKNVEYAAVHTKGNLGDPIELVSENDQTATIIIVPGSKIASIESEAITKELQELLKS